MTEPHRQADRRERQTTCRCLSRLLRKIYETQARPSVPGHRGITGNLAAALRLVRLARRFRDFDDMTLAS